MEPIDDLLEQHKKTHGSLCPGSLLALRLTVLGCALVDIEDPRGADQNKLIVWVEIDRWLADAVEAVTGARLGKRTLKFLDYGKLAATFLNIETGKAVRIVALGSSRRLADLRHPEIESRYARQMQTYREAAEEELFEVGTVEIHLRENDAPRRPPSRVICNSCDEEVNDGREVNLEDGSALCQPCAFVAGHQKFLSNSERQSQVTVSCA